MARVLLANYHTDLGTLDREYTYLFEIIYPSNRIVVDYGSSRRLVLLAAVHTQTGIELAIVRTDLWSQGAILEKKIVVRMGFNQSRVKF